MNCAFGPPPGRARNVDGPRRCGRDGAWSTLRPPPGAPRLFDQVRAAIRVRHYSFRTEKSYVYWIRRFILFHGKRHSRELGASEISAFLNHLAVVEDVAASTQNQALNALVFLYRWVLGRDAPELDDLVRARRPRRLPVVLTPTRCAVLSRLEGTHRLVAGLLDGSGLRLLEGLRLRVRISTSPCAKSWSVTGRDGATGWPPSPRRSWRTCASTSSA